MGGGDGAVRTGRQRAYGAFCVGLPRWHPRLVSRKAIKSRTAKSLDCTIAGSVEVKRMSRSLRQEGVPDADRHRLIIEVWRRKLDLRDPPDT